MSRVRRVLSLAPFIHSLVSSLSFFSLSFSLSLSLVYLVNAERLLAQQVLAGGDNVEVCETGKKRTEWEGEAG